MKMTSHILPLVLGISMVTNFTSWLTITTAGCYPYILFYLCLRAKHVNNTSFLLLNVLPCVYFCFVETGFAMLPRLVSRNSPALIS
jgi:hypothetical protein